MTEYGKFDVTVTCKKCGSMNVDFWPEIQCGECGTARIHIECNNCGEKN